MQQLMGAYAGQEVDAAAVAEAAATVAADMADVSMEIAPVVASSDATATATEEAVAAEEARAAEESGQQAHPARAGRDGRALYRLGCDRLKIGRETGHKVAVARTRHGVCPPDPVPPGPCCRGRHAEARNHASIGAALTQASKSPTGR